MSEKHVSYYSVEEARSEAEKICNTPGEFWPSNYKPLLGIAGTLLSSMQQSGYNERDFLMAMALLEHANILLAEQHNSPYLFESEGWTDFWPNFNKSK